MNSFYDSTTRIFSSHGGDGFTQAPVEAPQYRIGYVRAFGLHGKWEESMIAPVSRAAGRRALHRAGLLEQAEALLAQADIESRIWYADAQEWERSHHVVEQMRLALGLTHEQVDELFLSV